MPPIPTSEVSYSKKPVSISILLVFFPRKLSDTESRYSTFDQELLAAYASIRHFWYFCERHLFQLWTDHKPLVTSLSMSRFLFRSNSATPGFHFWVQCAHAVFACSCLVMSPPRPNQSTLGRWPPSKTTAQKRSACSGGSSLTVSFLPTRCWAPGWQSFNRHFLPSCFFALTLIF